MRIRRYQQALGVHESKDMRMRGYQQEHRIHEPKYSIRGCENTRLQANTHQPEDIRMQGCERGHMNPRI